MDATWGDTHGTNSFSSCDEGSGRKGMKRGCNTDNAPSSSSGGLDNSALSVLMGMDSSQELSTLCQQLASVKTRQEEVTQMMTQMNLVLNTILSTVSEVATVHLPPMLAATCPSDMPPLK